MERLQGLVSAGAASAGRTDDANDTMRKQALRRLRGSVSGWDDAARAQSSAMRASAKDSAKETGSGEGRTGALAVSATLISGGRLDDCTPCNLTRPLGSPIPRAPGLSGSLSSVRRAGRGRQSVAYTILPQGREQGAAGERVGSFRHSAPLSPRTGPCARRTLCWFRRCA